LTGISLYGKLIGLVTSLILSVGLAVVLTVRARLVHDLGLSLEERSVAIARDLASRAADLVLTDNTFALYQLVRDTVENNPDVRYAFITDARGQTLVHSFSQFVPPDLLRVNQPEPHSLYRLQPLDSDEGRLLDVAVPLLEGRAGYVRVGLSLRRLNLAVARATGELAAVTGVVLLFGVGITVVVARLLTRPLLELVQMSRQVGSGQLQARARVYMDDEIGELSRSFNAMAENLQQIQAKLLYRLQELATLNTIANAISSTLGVQMVLEAAVEKILETMGLKAGWVFLADESHPYGLKLAVQKGLSQAFVDEEERWPFEQCVCAHVLKGGRALVVSDILQECGRLRPQTLRAENLACHASVPLISHDRVIGVMNLASQEQRQFTFEDLALLDSIGRQIGVAVENARLWEEVKEKEALRGQLLEKVIAAQEAERQRLARELHDEAAQILTALSLGLRTLQDSPNLSLPQRQMVEQLKNQTTTLMQELHRMSVELRPSALDRLGLVAALEQYVREFGQRYGVGVEFEVEGLAQVRLPSEVEIHLYRIVQEALTNVARHAQATRVSVTMQMLGNLLVTTVEDDGQGFDIGHADKSGRLGLFGMQERAMLLGGVLHLESAPGMGTTVYVEIPLPEDERGEGVG
jgi:signal transduction histidine kinase